MTGGTSLLWIFIYTLQYQTISACVRFATVRIDLGAGLGHRFGDVLLGFQYAFEKNAEYVIPDGAFESKGGHGSYEWAPEFFGLNSIRTVEQVKAIYTLTEHHVEHWHHEAVDSGKCDVLLTTTDHACFSSIDPHKIDPHWCFWYKTGLYDGLREKMKSLYANTTYKPMLDIFKRQENPRKFVVAIHVREGDIQLNPDPEFYAQVLEYLRKGMDAYLYSIYFFSEKELSSTFQFVADLPYVQFIHNITEADTLYHLIHSDVLVTSGSSFAAIGALLAPHAVVLQTRAKEVNYLQKGRFCPQEQLDSPVDGVYEIASHGLIDFDGAVLRPSLEVFKERIKNLAASIME